MPPKRPYNHMKMKRKKKKRSFTKRIILVLIVVLLVTVIIAVDKKLFPTVLAMADLQARSIINDVIYQSVSTVVDKNSISSSDFYIISSNEDGFVNSLAVNTVLVNEICGKIGNDVSNTMIALGRQKIRVPLGILLGLDTLASIGPEYTVTLIPMGKATVNYETIFESVGINQINFQVWVNVDTVIQIVNPLQKSTETVSRKITLVNTVFAGKVPDSLFNNAPISVPVN